MLSPRVSVLRCRYFGARIQEAADLRVENLNLGEHLTVRLHLGFRTFEPVVV